MPAWKGEVFACKNDKTMPATLQCKNLLGDCVQYERQRLLHHGRFGGEHIARYCVAGLQEALLDLPGLQEQ